MARSVVRAVTQAFDACHGDGSDPAVDLAHRVLATSWVCPTTRGLLDNERLRLVNIGIFLDDAMARYDAEETPARVIADALEVAYERWAETTGQLRHLGVEVDHYHWSDALAARQKR